MPAKAWFQLALPLAAIGVLAGVAGAQGTGDRVRAAPSPKAIRLQVVFQPPAQGVKRDTSLVVANTGARPLLPDSGRDTLIAQTVRETPIVAICAGPQPDSAWLRVKVGDVMNDVIVALRPGLNRLALGAANVAINDGDVAEWSLATRSGQVILREYIQRRVVPIAPTVKALAASGIWYDTLDRFAREALRGVPLALERLDAFVASVGGTPCGDAADR